MDGMEFALLDLPVEMLNLILGFLEPLDLIHGLQLTCRKFYLFLQVRKYNICFMIFQSVLH